MSKDLIISPIFYMGNKKKLIKRGLIELFPKDINIFIDIFGGSGIVSMNVEAKKYVINDLDNNVYKFYEMFSNKSANEIINHVVANINKFGLKRIGVKQNTEESQEYKDKYINLRDYANSTDNIMNLYSCIFYAFSQQMRFNNKGKFNMPFGNGAFTKDNEQYIKDGCRFFSNPNSYISNRDFREFNWKAVSSKDFVYLDPPYFNTTATYNENGGWSEKDEKDLFLLCEYLNKRNIRFAMSNVFNCKGKENTHLIEWCNKNNWNVYDFEGFTYMACGKGNSNAKEVLITNY